MDSERIRRLEERYSASIHVGGGESGQLYCVMIDPGFEGRWRLLAEIKRASPFVLLESANGAAIVAVLASGFVTRLRKSAGVKRVGGVNLDLRKYAALLKSLSSKYAQENRGGES